VIKEQEFDKRTITIYHKEALVVGQGVPKVLQAFVFEISSKSLGAQKKHYCQIKAEILKFMWKKSIQVNN
jgi:hypothetical protein